MKDLNKKYIPLNNEYNIMLNNQKQNRNNSLVSQLRKQFQESLSKEKLSLTKYLEEEKKRLMNEIKEKQIEDQLLAW